MKYISVFSGIAGFELGIQQAYENLSKTKRKKQRRSSRNSSNVKQQQLAGQQPTCVGYSEIDKYAIQIYEKHFNHKAYGDITKINVQELPDFDLIVGGFPCQSFSIAGKRGGFEDTRGTLFFEIARIAKAKRPRLLLLENVEGLLSHDEGNTFATIIATLDELGYDCQWQVLNSKNFGVPQNRKRVFIIGHLRGTPRPKVFPIGEGNKRNPKKRKGDARQEVAWALRSRDYKDGTNFFIHNVYGGFKEKMRIFKDCSPTIRTPKGGGHLPMVAEIVKTLKRDNLEPTKKGWRSLLKGVKIRKPTPTECERLQGFPDGWTEGVSDTQRYKTLGNAVTVNVVEEIIKRLFKNP